MKFSKKWGLIILAIGVIISIVGAIDIYSCPIMARGAVTPEGMCANPLLIIGFPQVQVFIALFSIQGIFNLSYHPAIFFILLGTSILLFLATMFFLGFFLGGLIPKANKKFRKQMYDEEDETEA